MKRQRRLINESFSCTIKGLLVVTVITIAIKSSVHLLDQPLFFVFIATNVITQR